MLVSAGPSLCSSQRFSVYIFTGKAVVGSVSQRVEQWDTENRPAWTGCAYCAGSILAGVGSSGKNKLESSQQCSENKTLLTQFWKTAGLTKLTLQVHWRPRGQRLNHTRNLTIDSWLMELTHFGTPSLLLICWPHLNRLSFGSQRAHPEFRDCFEKPWAIWWMRQSIPCHSLFSMQEPLYRTYSQC